MKERIITGLCLLAIVLPIVYVGETWFAGLIGFASGIAAWEMVQMHDQLNKKSWWIKSCAILMTIAIAFSPSTEWALVAAALYVASFFLGSWVFKSLKIETLGFYALTVFYIGFSFRAFLEIRYHSLMLLIFLMMIVVLTDSFAYFAGRFFGKHKLAPKISPKKTVEGALGGWLAGAIFAVVFGLTQNLFTEIWILVILAIALPILSQIGDLIASALKRKHDIKDFGKIFPGHGGVMDRVDSQLLAGILLYVILCLGGLS